MSRQRNGADDNYPLPANVQRSDSGHEGELPINEDALVKLITDKSVDVVASLPGSRPSCLSI